MLDFTGIILMDFRNEKLFLQYFTLWLILQKITAKCRFLQNDDKWKIRFIEFVTVASIELQIMF